MVLYSLAANLIIIRPRALYKKTAFHLEGGTAPCAQRHAAPELRRLLLWQQRKKGRSRAARKAFAEGLVGIQDGTRRICHNNRIPQRIQHLTIRRDRSFRYGGLLKTGAPFHSSSPAISENRPANLEKDTNLFIVKKIIQ
ncbi:hypothetical protein SDC9_197209 [bioreactor metagenome]|uniref:Uncharacterized protein n=1 Tax=bioreactor metagenome TaxID=1076179 RepID=A0A645IE95_9ZZZZ